MYLLSEKVEINSQLYRLPKISTFPRGHVTIEIMPKQLDSQCVSQFGSLILRELSEISGLPAHQENTKKHCPIWSIY